MPKIAKLIAVATALVSLLAAPAGAVDLRSPDAVDASVQAQQSQSKDLRSPDAVDSATSVGQGPTYATTQVPPSSSDDDFEWGFVGLGIVAALSIGGLIVTVRQRHRRRSAGQLIGARS